ncbi:TetR/AcrR family transcriptional regulator [Nocardiopsis valliformis]|uniref:TetR/AcrR family transcriptional regulator n=1 Tax=Nocardiopsis valliformis TaxID=239974 RepID=UPI0003456D9C|nr:TetR/AcrR family transcriptional regulator [Nocardiopsis valliformis]
MTSPDTRTRILDAAVELIARDGYDGVRLAEIAKRAGASTALLHYHFANRAQLLAAAISHSLDRERSRAERRAHAQERSSPAERVADQIDFWLPISPDDVREWLLWSELEGRAVRDQDLAKALTDLYTRLRAPLVEAIADGVATGDFGPCDPEESAAVAHALLGGMTVRLLARDPGLTLPCARGLAGRHVALTVGYPGTLPFADRDIPLHVPDPGIEPAPPRRRAARATRSQG